LLRVCGISLASCVSFYIIALHLATPNFTIFVAKTLPNRAQRCRADFGPDVAKREIGNADEIAGTEKMAKRHLTDRTLKALKAAPPGTHRDVWDTGFPGFGVRVSDTGRKTFVLAARYPGSNNPTRRALGQYGPLSLEKARTKASEWLELVRKGIDPATEEQRQRQAELRKQKNTFASVAEAYIVHIHRQKQRKADVVERELRREFIERWGERPITDIQPEDVIAVLDEAVKRGAEYQAHNLLGHIRRLFNWAIARNVYGLERGPCDRMKPKDVIGTRTMRDRTLTDDELRVFWRATGRLKYPWAPFFRMLLLTGQRKSEVSDARWSEFNLDGALWTIPPERFKSGSEHLVPLTSEVLALLRTLPHFKKGDHLFSTTFGQKPIDGFSKAKARLDRRMLRTLRAMARMRGEDHPKKVKLPPFVIHDVRRTVRTRLSALRIPDTVAEMVIGHGRKGLQRVYDQHKFIDEMREALTAWAARLRDIVEPPPANVVKLAKARG
jgi:integrase